MDICIKCDTKNVVRFKRTGFRLVTQKQKELPDLEATQAKVSRGKRHLQTSILLHGHLRCDPLNVIQKGNLPSDIGKNYICQNNG